MSTRDEEMVLTHFIVSDDVERSRRFYTWTPPQTGAVGRLDDCGPCESVI